MYYQAKVKIKFEDKKGNQKAKTFIHIVEDEAISGVEVQINKEYANSTNDWELVSVSETKIESIITPKGTRA